MQKKNNYLVERITQIFTKIDTGSLSLKLPDGSHQMLGSGDKPEAALIINNWRAIRRLLTKGEMGFVESYLDGDWDSPNPAKVVELAIKNKKGTGTNNLNSFWHRLTNRIIHILNANTKRGAKRNISAHYDLGNNFYQQWLDPSMTYSSAYFNEKNLSLEDAQQEKYRRIAESLELKPDHKLLEIGFGWGGFAEFVIKEYGCHVTGLTLSNEQLKYASKRLQAAGLSEKANLKLQDYRDLEGQFDNVASIEMFEAVGEENWPEYFNKIRNVLDRKGSAVLQIITINEDSFDTYRRSADFIQRYIFPGGMLPSVNALKNEISAAKLQITDVSMFGDSYAETLMQWRYSFEAAWSKIEQLGFDNRFKRMWEMYLCYCEGGFRARAINVGQYKIASE
jgi:cyclopropane-fatty-acyl-phospholipid synthase